MKIIKVAQFPQSPDIQSFMKKWNDFGIELFVHEGSDYIKLMQIVVPKKQRGRGTGTIIMNELTELADKLGKKILLTPDVSYGGSSKDRLKRFYKRFDFVENKGRNKDYSKSDTMYRRPSERLNENN